MAIPETIPAPPIETLTAWSGVVAALAHPISGTMGISSITAVPRAVPNIKMMIHATTVILIGHLFSCTIKRVGRLTKK